MKIQITAISVAWTLAALLTTAHAAVPMSRSTLSTTACSDTTSAAYTACQHDVLDSFWIASGKCYNERDAADRASCLSEAKAASAEGTQVCGAQRTERKKLCTALGEAPYDPSFEPGQFVDPREVGRSVAPNPWFPLTHRTMVYKSAEETVRVVTTDKVKIIDNVPCLVVLDTVEVDGAITESTIDWFAQDVHGNVWYCGEATAEYGEDGVPVNVDGSFQADEEGARPGIVAKAAPAAGDVYRQEFDLGNAEDAAKVLSLTGSAQSPVASCRNTCLVTEESTPLEPGAIENKYYKPGIGFIFQVTPATGDTLKLVEIIN
jgi:hypothetical protein